MSTFGQKSEARTTVWDTLDDMPVLAELRGRIDS